MTYELKMDQDRSINSRTDANEYPCHRTSSHKLVNYGSTGRQRLGGGIYHYYGSIVEFIDD